MIPQWFIVAALAGLASNGFNFVNRYLLRNHPDSTAYGWWFEFIRMAFFLILVTRDFFIQLSAGTLLLLFSLGIVEFFSIYIFMKMHANTHLSISSIIGRLRVVWVPILAFLFLGERLTLLDYAGILIIFLGQSVVLSPKELRFDKGVKLSLLSSVMVAVLSLLTKASAEIASTPVVLVFMSTLSVFAFPVAMKDWSNRVKDFWKLDKFKILIGVALNISAMYFLVWAYRIGSVTKVTGVYNSMMIIVVLSGIIFLQEKEMYIRKILGSFITIAGLLLIA